jgi:hypothetical protein
MLRITQAIELQVFQRGICFIYSSAAYLGYGIATTSINITFIIIETMNHTVEE